MWESRRDFRRVWEGWARGASSCEKDLAFEGMRELTLSRIEWRSLYPTSTQRSSWETCFKLIKGCHAPRTHTLLLAFRKARPLDFVFLKATDLINLQNSSFAGIEDWEAFSRHYGSCELCNA